MWVKHSTTRNKERYHLNCRDADGRHDYDASVILHPEHGVISLHLPPKTVKEDTTLSFETRRSLNHFLKTCRLEALQNVTS